MNVIVYVETNFLMSVAMGREELSEALLSEISPSTRIAIPLSCYMESFSAFEDEKKHRKRFRGELDKQIGQLRRDTTSQNAGALLSRLEESRIANDQLLNDIQARLFELVGRAASILEPIVEEPSIIRDAVTKMIIPDPTDNLILHSIIAHASRFPEATKAILTENTKDFDTEDVQAALAAAGINKTFRSVEKILDWLRSFPH